MGAPIPVDLVIERVADADFGSLIREAPQGRYTLDKYPVTIQVVGGPLRKASMVTVFGKELGICESRPVAAEQFVAPATAPPFVMAVLVTARRIIDDLVACGRLG